jgi:cobalt-precorrin-5B (C1)-methyltransferase
MNNLKSGYTTGTHTTAVIVGLFYDFLYDIETKYLKVTLPKEKEAFIEIQKVSKYSYKTIKTDNDDLDVTKGATIKASLYLKQPHTKPQTPHIIEVNQAKIYIFASNGVGIVTKEGLKVKPTYPAINPTPLQMIKTNLLGLNLPKQNFYITVEVQNGKELAKQTANEKVGVIGGISILGTTGIVKPISSNAYIQSIKTEISVASNYCDTIVLTLGNTAFDFAKQNYKKECIVEIGNFVYDSLNILKEYNFKKVLFITSIAKMTKVAQKARNTHNRFGGINFLEVYKWVEKELKYNLKQKEFLTLKALLEVLPNEIKEKFYIMIEQKANTVLKEWYNKEIQAKILKGN